MAVSIRIQGAAFTKFFDIDPSFAPHIESARAFYLLGGNAAESLKNRVPNAAAPTATAIGAPVYGKGYARLSCAETNGISGGFNFGTQEHTHIVVAARQGALNRIFAGYWKQSANVYEAAVGMSADFKSVNAYMDNESRAALMYVPPIGQFTLLASTYDGVNVKAYAHNGTSLQSASSAYTAGALSTNAPFLIGASGVGSGDFDAAAVMTFNKALTAAEISELYAYFKQLMPVRGVQML